MKKTKIIVLINKPLSKEKVSSLSMLSNIYANMIELIDLTFHQDDQIGFRASWILENIYTSNIERFLPQASYFLKRFSEQSNLSARRHFTKILALMTKKNAPNEIKSIVKNYDTNNLVETVFGWLIDENVPVAVKSHCLNILANLHEKHNWIKDELIETMDFLVDRESVGFYAKVKQIRKQLK